MTLCGLRLFDERKWEALTEHENDFQVSKYDERMLSLGVHTEMTSSLFGFLVFCQKVLLTLFAPGCVNFIRKKRKNFDYSWFLFLAHLSTLLMNLTFLLTVEGKLMQFQDESLLNHKYF